MCLLGQFCPIAHCGSLSSDGRKTRSQLGLFARHLLLLPLCTSHSLSRTWINHGDAPDCCPCSPLLSRREVRLVVKRLTPHLYSLYCCHPYFLICQTWIHGDSTSRCAILTPDFQRGSVCFHGEAFGKVPVLLLCCYSLLRSSSPLVCLSPPR